MPSTRTPRIPPLPDDLTPRQLKRVRETLAEFDQQLATLREPDARARLDEVLASHGRVLPRPKAGTSF